MWIAVLALLCAAPNYDAFCDRSGHIADERPLEAAQAMMRDPEQLEAVYADAAKKNPRAARVVEELEQIYFPGIGRAVAEREAQLQCTVMAYRELSQKCVPDWSYLDFLRRDAPGGVRARKAISDGYVARAKELAIENRVILATVNALLAVAVVQGVASKAPAATAGPAVMASELDRLAESGVIDPGRIRFTQDSIKATLGGGSTIDELASGLRSGAVKPSEVPPIRIFERDGKLFTLDNRRLEAFRRAQVQVPYRKATPKEIADEAWKLTTKNDGESVRVRRDGKR